MVVLTAWQKEKDGFETYSMEMIAVNSKENLYTMNLHSTAPREDDIKVIMDIDEIKYITTGHNLVKEAYKFASLIRDNKYVTYLEGHLTPDGLDSYMIHDTRYEKIIHLEDYCNFIANRSYELSITSLGDDNYGNEMFSISIPLITDYNVYDNMDDEEVIKNCLLEMLKDKDINLYNKISNK